ncbi:hypothetical protein ACL9RL_14285 [Plantibacter sp. Mn2098]|uniref:hypothetical protein n=1 Tax=Plantibacter sp. Mn2098 TaxID=3395266 RepID=UPI003BD63CBC
MLTDTRNPSRFARTGMCAAVLTTVAAAILVPTTASASTGTALDFAAERAARASMTDGGISPTTQDQLIAKLRSGVLPDSSLGGEPVNVFTETHDDSIRTVQDYADGSRRWIDIQRPTTEGNKTRAGLDNCSSSGGWVNNCRVWIADAVSSARFDIDYQPSSSGQAKVRDYRSATCGSIVGGCSVSGGIQRATQSSSGPAWAQLDYTAQIAWGEVHGSFGIRVSGNSVSVY